MRERMIWMRVGHGLTASIRMVTGGCPWCGCPGWLHRSAFKISPCFCGPALAAWPGVRLREPALPVRFAVVPIRGAGAVVRVAGALGGPVVGLLVTQGLAGECSGRHRRWSVGSGRVLLRRIGLFRTTGRLGGVVVRFGGKFVCGGETVVAGRFWVGRRFDLGR